MASTPLLTVGLEVHARLLSPTKMFCSCENKFGASPNTLVCPVCLGLPGTLPVFQENTAELAIKLGVALGCEVNRRSEFSRKHYFYPDLPRNYQITQYRFPLCSGGHLVVDGHNVQIRRIHLEEDAGRSLHQPGQPSRIDLNRAGTPLMEIVTEPDLRSGSQARQWLRSLRKILVFLEVCDGEMATGSLRCDANVGIAGAGVLVEIKNLNSFRAVGRAVDYERKRLGALLANGENPQPETRLWDEKNQSTTFMRFKEETRDYRYFPEPDLPPLIVAGELVQKLREELQELPMEMQMRLERVYGVTTEDSITLCQTPELAEYFEKTATILAENTKKDIRAVASLVCAWVLKDVLQICAEQGLSRGEYPVTEERLAGLLALLHQAEISVASARKVFLLMVANLENADARDLVRMNRWELVSDTEVVGRWCLEVLESHPQQVAAFMKGKSGLFDYFVGQVMAVSRGRACPRETRRCFTDYFENLSPEPPDA